MFNIRMLIIATGILTMLYSVVAQDYTLVDVHVNFLHSIEGQSVFDREKFITMHSTYVDNGAIRSEDMGYLAGGLRINFGRETGTIYWSANQVEEDELRPGHADLNHLRELGSVFRDSYNHNRDPYRTNEVILSTIERPFYPDGTLTDQGWAFADEHATAEFIAHFIEEYYGNDAELEPKFYEVINEPDYYLGHIPVNDIINYHRAVKDSVRKYNPHILIGGFSAANTRFEQGNFALWNNYWKPFIDQIGDQMDFFSFHIYDFPHHNNNIMRKGSNTEAIFDMLEQYSMILYDEVKPLLISEYGACCPDGTDDYTLEERDWAIMKSYTGQLMSMLNRSHIILKATPFVMANTSSWAGEGYPHDIYYNGIPGDRFSEHIKYYQLWSDVDGIRVHSESADPDLQSDAYVFTDRIFLILNNLNTTETDVIIKLHRQKDYVLEDVMVKNMYWGGSSVQLDETILYEEPEYVTIGPEGTVILRYNYRDTIPLNERYAEKKYYASTYLQTINQNTELVFNINGVDISNTMKATLRIGIGRDHGYSVHPQITFNGVIVEVPMDYMGYDQYNRSRFFGVIEVPISSELIEQNNQVGVTFTDGSNGHVSSVTMQVASLSNEIASSEVPDNWSRPGSIPSGITNGTISIFPNPAGDRLIIVQVSGEMSHAVIRSVNGIMMHDIQLHTGENSIDISDISQGVYIISVCSDNMVISQKLVVR